MGLPGPLGKEIFGVNPQPKHGIGSDLRKKMICDSPGGSIDLRVCHFACLLRLVRVENIES